MYGAPESRSSWWRSMATVVLGRESSERKERSMDALNRWGVRCPAGMAQRHVFLLLLLHYCCQNKEFLEQPFWTVQHIVGTCGDAVKP